MKDCGKVGKVMRKACCALLALVLALLPCLGLGQEDTELSLGDLIIEEDVSYDDVPWNFPIDISDMNPEFIRLANREILLPKDFVPEPLMVMKNRNNGGVNKASSSEMKLHETAGNALIEMFEAALTQDITLYLKSAYRSYQTQATMYYNRLESNNGKDDGWVTPAGASDHQTGLGCDVVPRGWRDRAMNEDMAEEVECQWMAEHCAEFGFILRYPADKEDITEINYEPWHLRYVGKEVATYIMDNGLCLEEFHQQLQAAIDEFLAAGGKTSLVEDLIQVSAENE